MHVLALLQILVTNTNFDVALSSNCSKCHFHTCMFTLLCTVHGPGDFMHKQVDRKPINGSGGCMGKGIGLPQSLFIIQVVPYWGNAQDRKILRKFWDSKSLHTESASFHVVITSYQLVIQDVKYFQRIKWQYLVLDEAQAIKSTSRSAFQIANGLLVMSASTHSGHPVLTHSCPRPHFPTFWRCHLITSCRRCIYHDNPRVVPN